MLSHSYVFKVTQPRYLTVFIFFPIKEAGPSPPKRPCRMKTKRDNAVTLTFDPYWDLRRVSSSAKESWDVFRVQPKRRENRAAWRYCVTHTIASSSIGPPVKRMSEMNVLDNRGGGNSFIGHNQNNIWMKIFICVSTKSGQCNSRTFSGIFPGHLLCLLMTCNLHFSCTKILM